MKMFPLGDFLIYISDIFTGHFKEIFCVQTFSLVFQLFQVIFCVTMVTKNAKDC